MKPDRRSNQLSDPFIADDLSQMEDAENYNNWLFSLINPYMKGSVLEVGPGIGNISTRIIPEVDLIVGIEPNPYCTTRLSEIFRNNQKFVLVQTPIETLNKDDLLTYQFDTILCMNVLEHIKDDRSVLKLFRDIILPEGKIVLLLPAVPAAYGPIDASIGHFRRYSRDMISEAAKDSGLKIETLFYSNFVGLLGWAFNSHVLRIVKQSDQQISLFDKLVPLLSSIERVFPPPIGMSMLVVGSRV